jgi:hypothetical protein
MTEITIEMVEMSMQTEEEKIKRSKAGLGING